MEYIVAAAADIGNTKEVNQDSLCVKTARCKQGKVALAMVCDGMGGLSKGELASAVVVRSFSDWFEKELPFMLEDWKWDAASKEIVKRIRRLNSLIVDYGTKNSLQLGTTCTGIIAINSRMMTFHVGDTRIYKLSNGLSILTEDHTFVNREIKRGNMTPEEAANDPRKNALTQCVGVTGTVVPEIQFANIESGANYMICSDGFRHVITEEEILESLSPKKVTAKTTMEIKMRGLIDEVKKRGERDNISVVMFRAET